MYVSLDRGECPKEMESLCSWNVIPLSKPMKGRTRPSRRELPLGSKDMMRRDAIGLVLWNPWSGSYCIIRKDATAERAASTAFECGLLVEPTCCPRADRDLSNNKI